jgi:hypothetical protein
MRWERVDIGFEGVKWNKTRSSLVGKKDIATYSFGVFSEGR